MKTNKNEDKPVFPSCDASIMYKKMNAARSIKELSDTMNEFMDLPYSAQERQVMMATFDAVKKILVKKSQQISQGGT